MNNDTTVYLPGASPVVSRNLDLQVILLMILLSNNAKWNTVSVVPYY